ncbi:MAG: hypothetical protein IJ239_01485 [Eubacterium sp.]|nr:hypothetical protein [Eubacterium sp.]
MFGGKDTEKHRCLTKPSEDTADCCQNDLLPSAADIRASYAPLLFMLLASILFCLLIRQDTNRSVFLYLPLLVCLSLGLDKITECRTSLGIAASAVLLTGLILFARDYFGSYYENLAGANFMPGYGDAIQYAYHLRREMLGDKGHIASAAQPEDSAAGSAPAIPIYSTYESVASPYMSALYYCAYDPYRYLETVHYKDADAEFRIADSFGEFTFGLPVPDLTSDIYKNAVLVLTAGEDSQLPPEEFEITLFRSFTVVVSRSVEDDSDLP